MQQPAAGSTPSLFGSTPAAGLSGNQASTGGLFGAASSANASGGLFGGGAANAPSPSLFGPSPASSGGGLFGAQPAASSAAGGGLFGTPASASSGGGMFGGGAASSAGLFGGQASAGGLFGGGGAASSGGMFGGGAASGGGLFGGGGIASGGGLFGGGGGAASGGGLFGASSAATGGLFGASSGQLVAAGQSAAGQGTAAAGGQLDPVRLQQISQEQASLFASIQEYDAAFTPGKGKLTRLLLYVLDPSQHARPPNIPEAQWQFALRKAGGPNNAARVWPVAVQGSGQLKEHRDAQQKGAEANRAYLSELHGVIQRLAADEEHELRRRAALVLRTHAELAHRLLKVVRLVDALESRVVSSSSSTALYAKLQSLSEKLQLLEAQLAPTNVKGLRHSVDALAAAVDLQASVASAAPASALGVGEQTLADAAALLGEQNRGVASLHDHLRRVERDIALVLESAKGPDMLMVTSQP